VNKFNQGGSPADIFAFHPAFAGFQDVSDFSLKGGETSQAHEITCNLSRPGQNECAAPTSTVQVAERPTPGYTLGAVACRYTQSYDDNGDFTAGPPNQNSPLKPASEATTDLANGTVDLKVHFNEWVLCWSAAAAAGPRGRRSPADRTFAVERPPGRAGAQRGARPTQTSATSA